MGWTGYYGLTAQEAIQRELDDYELTVIKRSGNWILSRNSGGHIGLIHFLTQRHDGQALVKPIEITMGPGIVPPRAIAQAYVDYYDGDIDKAGGHYGAEILRTALAPKRNDVTNIRPGMTFTMSEGGTWSDGTPFGGEYTYLGKYRARRDDGITVKLPRWWRRRATATLVAA